MNKIGLLLLPVLALFALPLGSFAQEVDPSEAFLKAYIEAMKMTREQPDVGMKAIAKYTQIADAEALKAAYETFLPAFQQRVPYVSRDSVRGVLNFSTSAEAKAQRAENLIDHSFLEKIEASSFVKTLYGDAKPE